jgi:hypothetical protein
LGYFVIGRELSRFLTPMPAAKPKVTGYGPHELPEICVRGALRTLFTGLHTPEWPKQRERMALILAVPEPRGAMLDGFTETLDMLTAAMAQRAGGSPDDAEVRSLAGAILGVGIAAMTPLDGGPLARLAERMDESLQHLARGLPL